MQVLDWESKFLNVLEEEADNEPRNSSIHLYYEAGRSFGDISGKSMFQDLGKLIIGIVLMYAFIQLVMPTHYNRIEMRVRSLFFNYLQKVMIFCVNASFH